MIFRKQHAKIIAILALALLTVVLAACGRQSRTPEPTATPAPVTATPKPTATPEPVIVTATPAPVVTPSHVSRADGERFEDVIVIEGMEEKVPYEHIRNEALGFEMDYDYERFARRSEPNREIFISVWDDPDNIENYLEVITNTGNADLVADAINGMLSGEYDTYKDYRELEHGGRSIFINADIIKGTNNMPENLQEVYVIPAPNGCIIASAHCFITESEGFLRRFAYMVNTIAPIGSVGESRLTDEQAVAAIRNYCLSRDPELQSIVDAGEYPVYWDITSSDANEIVVVFRAATGALNRYYIDPVSGQTYVTEQIPGIIDEEQRTGETLNARDYFG